MSLLAPHREQGLCTRRDCATGCRALANLDLVAKHEGSLLRLDRGLGLHYYDLIDGLTYIMGRGLLPRELWVQR
eukprot:11829180-Heterocapsa_arctica.AAC.1